MDTEGNIYLLKSLFNFITHSNCGHIHSSFFLLSLFFLFGLANCCRKIAISVLKLSTYPFQNACQHRRRHRLSFQQVLVWVLDRRFHRRRRTLNARRRLLG